MARTVLVTGASRGIGKATAVAFAAQGANVVLTSRKQDTLDEVAAEILAAHPDVGVLAHAAHAARPDEAAACVDAAVAKFGQIDVLVNNAGTNPYFGPLMDIDPVVAEKTTALNQFGVVLWSQLAWKASMSQHGGSIVNVASVGGLLTEPGIGYYNSTKAAVIHLTRQMAAELAPAVRVNAVAPGIVRTHLAKALWENFEDRLKEALPLGRIGEPDDIADAILFLANDSARWITGQTLVIDGGAQIRSSIG
jgi:NAD(P)-dependent dehydrogenase (short-subunit alcohol dehydrogenase family)